MQTIIKDIIDTKYQPISSIQNNAPLDFDVSRTGKQYIDLANIQLYICMKIMQANGTTMLTNVHAIVPVN